MPTASVDTFFACSLMIIVVLSAMAATSKILNPYVENSETPNMKEKYSEISKNLLLYAGEPSGWGHNGQTKPARFGLADDAHEMPYELDIDKVCRLNSMNAFAVDYADVQEALRLPDASFHLQIKPIFNVTISLAETFVESSNTTYEFQIITEKDGAPIPAYLKWYLVVNNQADSYEPEFSEGTSFVSVTLSNSISCSALLVVFARHVYAAAATSFGTFQFEHGSVASFPNGTFLRLSPLNNSLNISIIHPDAYPSDAYALTFDYSCTLVQTINESQSATYEIKRFIGASPMVIVSTGWNSTVSFAEWVSYPQVPLLFGTVLSVSHSLSNTYAYSFTVIMDSVFYDCTIWLGGTAD